MGFRGLGFSAWVVRLGARVYEGFIRVFRRVLLRGLIGAYVNVASLGCVKVFGFYEGLGSKRV